MSNNRISSNEYEYVKQVLDTDFRSSKGGGMTKKLEALFREKFGVKHAIAHCNGTATMHCGLVAANIKPGDEVIVPPLTMASTSFAVLNAYAVPVFADVDPNTFVIDPEDIKRKITPKTKAIIPVSLYGLSPDMEKIHAIAKQHGLVVLEDNAECFLGYQNGKMVGTHCDMASYSFQSSKHMASGEGGMLTTNDDALADKIRKYNSLGYAGVSATQVKISKDDIQSPDYTRHIQHGFNFRISELCAAVALGQLERLEELVAQRVEAAKSFDAVASRYPFVRAQRVPQGYVHSYWTYVFAIEDPAIDWHDFRKMFKSFGGDNFYAAWKLTYHEPAFQNRTFLSPENAFENAIYKDYTYPPGLCPNAEKLQPRLVQLKTNYYGDKQRVEAQCKALEKTLRYFAGTI
jgi:perosamine synthetase